jgi:hypothetical protein
MTTGPPGDDDDEEGTRDPTGLTDGTDATNGTDVRDGTDLETIRDLVALTRDREGPAIVSSARATDYSARDFATGVRKAANLLSHFGAGPDRPVAVAIGAKDSPVDGPPGWLGSAADPLLAILGAMSLGAPADPAPTLDVPVEAPVLVAPAAWLDRFEVRPGTAVIAYGGPPSDPAVSHFERERWSENPTVPPEPLEPDRTALQVAGDDWTHAHLLADARSVLAGGDLVDAVRVDVASPVDAAGPFVAGVLAPLLAGVPIQPLPGRNPGDRGADEAGQGIFGVTAGGDRWRLEVPTLD